VGARRHFARRTPEGRDGMKQVLIRQGRVVVEEMPAPTCGPREVLVATAFSVISSGTESACVRASEPPGAVSRWTHRVKKAGEVLEMVTRRGLRETGAAVRARIQGPSAVAGYSLSGTVLQVGAEIANFVPGQRAACGGAASAHHAELVAVPQNLVVPVPESLSLEHAALVTLGAIALQGVRQADARLGEIVCVVGLGVIGQITVSLLQAAGCRVVGVDLDPERVERAVGLEAGLVAGREDVEQAIDHLTAGRGVDTVVLTAATPSSEPIQQAVRLLRRRGRVVVLGDVGMEIDRAPFYMKEAELRISCSYGPGRYDPAYERDGHDYPYEHVRWTENRNMAEFLRLAAAGRLPLDRWVDFTIPIDDAGWAYDELSRTGYGGRPLTVLLQYPRKTAAADLDAPGARRVDVVPSSGTAGLGVALVGPGTFARAVQLPNLASLSPAASLRAVVGRTANSAREAARIFAACYATTDLDEVLRDEDVAIALICTRHDQHAAQAKRALEAGKAVFLEKPAALNDEELDGLEAAVLASGRPFTVGFNRRFSPTVEELRRALERRHGPLSLQYRVNAGKLPRDHWTLGPRGGGRLIGEACHMIDLMGHLVGKPREGWDLRLMTTPPGRDDLPTGDNFTLSLRYSDGSLGVLSYGSVGDPSAGKERIELHCDGQSAVVEDFRPLTPQRGNSSERKSRAADKGHAELLRRFVEHVHGRAAEPIPLAELLDVSRFVLELDRTASGAARIDAGP